MFERVKPYIRGRVLEVGSGVGDLTAVCFQQGISMYLSDGNEAQRDFLKARFAGEAGLKGVIPIDLADTDFEAHYEHFLGVFDTIVALNVSSPLVESSLALSNCNKLLRRGGYFFVLFPAHAALYNGLDQGLKYWYNYNLSLINKSLFFDFDVIKARYFNIGESSFASDQITRYNKYVPLFRIEDALAIPPKGLSVLVVGKKKKV